MDLGERIKYFRATKEVAIERLAEALGVDADDVMAMEEGESPVLALWVPALVRAFDVTYDEFFGTRPVAEDLHTEILIQNLAELDVASRREVSDFVDFLRSRSGLGDRVTPGNARCTVLVVDDQPSVRQTIVHAVDELTRHRVIEAEGVDQALAAMDEHDVDLLITDLVMPRKSGIDLIAAVRLRSADLPIIALSGYTDIFEANENLDVDVLRAKPLSLQGLVDDVERLLAAAGGDEEA